MKPIKRLFWIIITILAMLFIVISVIPLTIIMGADKFLNKIVEPMESKLYKKVK
jgi:hypothetical protein